MPLKPFTIIPKGLREWDEWCRNTTVEPSDGTVTEAMLADDAVSNRVLRNSAAFSVIGNPTGSSGNPADIAAGADDRFLARRSGALQFVALLDGDIPGTLARSADVTTAIGNAITTHEGASNPHPTYLTQTEGDARYVQETSGSFTATLTGCTTSPTGTCQYVKVGSMVVLSIQTITGTSNTTAATLTGIPAGIRPLTAQTFIARTVDNSVNNVSRNVIETDGTITLTASIGGAAFTNSGTKGFGDTVFSYLMT